MTHVLFLLDCRKYLELKGLLDLHTNILLASKGEHKANL
jgi:hypothetical protein